MKSISFNMALLIVLALTLSGYQAAAKEYPNTKGNQSINPEPTPQNITEVRVTGGWYGSVAAQQGKILYLKDPGGFLSSLDLNTGILKRLTQERGLESVAVSGDGKQIAYTFNQSENIQVLQILSKGGSNSETLKLDQNLILKAWTSDQRELIVFSLEGIVALDTKNGNSRIVVPDSELTLHWPNSPEARISPDGKFIVYENDSAVYIATVDGQARNLLVRAPGFTRSPVWSPDGHYVIYLGGAPYSKWDLWALEIEDGRPKGPAKQLVENMGLIRAIAITNTGSFLYIRSGRIDNIVRIKLDPDNFEIIGTESEFLRGEKPCRAGSWSPDGKHFAFLTRKPIGEDPPIQDTWRPAVFHSDTKRTNVFNLEPEPPSTLYSEAHPLWAPDNRFLLFDIQEGIYSLDIITGKHGWAFGERPVSSEGSPNSVYYHSYGWADDNQTLVYGCLSSLESNNSMYGLSVRKRNIASGEELEIWKGETSERFGSGLLSPDGNFLTLQDNHSLSVLDLGKGTKQKLLQEPWYSYAHDWMPDSQSIIVTGNEWRGLLNRRYNIQVELEGFPIKSIPNENTFKLYPPLLRMGGNSIESGRSFTEHLAKQDTTFWIISLPDGKIRKIGTQSVQTSYDSQGARYLSVHPDSLSLCYTEGGSFMDIWLMEGLITKLDSVFKQ